MVSAELNLVACFITSAAAGLGAGFFGVVLSLADKIKRANGGVKTKRSRFLMVSGAVGSTCMGLASIAALYFGPITLVTIIRAGVTLPANAFFSQFLGLRRLVKDDYLGTLSCICGVVCFVCFQGPPEPPPSTTVFMLRFTSVPAIAWNSVLFVTLLGAVGLVVYYELKGPISYKGVVYEAGTYGKAAAVSIVIGCSSSFMDVAIKGWSATIHDDRTREDALTTPLFWVAFLSNTLFLVIMRLGMIFGCARTDVLLFVPLSQVLNVFLSVATGMVVLDEGRDVYSWTGIVFSMISVVAGLLMLIQGPGEEDAEEKDRPDLDQVTDSVPSQSSLNAGPPTAVPWPPTTTIGTSRPGLPEDAGEAPEDKEEEDGEEVSSDESDSEDHEGGSLVVAASNMPEYSDIYIPRPITLLRLNEWHERAAACRDRSVTELQEFRRRMRQATSAEHPRTLYGLPGDLRSASMSAVPNGDGRYSVDDSAGRPPDASASF